MKTTQTLVDEVLVTLGVAGLLASVMLVATIRPAKSEDTSWLLERETLHRVRVCDEAEYRRLVYQNTLERYLRTREVTPDQLAKQESLFRSSVVECEVSKANEVVYARNKNTHRQGR